MDLIVLIVALVLAGGLFFIVSQKLARDERRFNALYRPPEQSDDDDPWADVIVFEGQFTFESDVFPLTVGRQRLRYWFPDDVLIKVELFSAAGDDSEVLVIKAGEGEHEFMAVGGEYFCTVEPSEEPAEWEIEFSPLGLPSSRAPHQMHP